MPELPYYRGEAVRAVEQPTPMPPRDVISKEYSEGLKYVGRNLGELGEALVTLDDDIKVLQANKAMMQMESEVNMESIRRLALPDGDEESFFEADGTLRQGAVTDFVNERKNILNGLSKGVINSERRARLEQATFQFGVKLEGNLLENGMKAQVQKRQQLFEDNLELAELQENWGGAMGLIDDGVASGHISPVQAQIMKLKLQKRRASSVGRSAAAGFPETISIGGVDYDGDSAALAMSASKQGMYTQESTMPEEIKPADGVSVEEPTAGEQEVQVSKPDIQSTLYTMGGMPTFDSVSLFSTSEVLDLSKAFDNDNAIRTTAKDDGTPTFECEPIARNSVMAATARANENKELSYDDARTMLVDIAYDQYAKNPDVTESDVLGLFAKAGVFEALGHGDATIGENEAKALLGEIHSRVNYGTTKLSMKGIENMIDSYILSPEFGKGSEWRNILDSRPNLKKDEKWDKGDTEESRARWFNAFGFYKKYRNEYDSSLEGEPDKDEFNERAYDFYNWLVENKAKPMRDQYEKQAKDILRGRAVDKLKNQMAPAKDGSIAYANELETARSVINEGISDNDVSVDAVMKQQAVYRENDKKRSEAFAKIVAENKAYEKLKQAKQDTQTREADRKARKEAAEEAAKKSERAMEREYKRRRVARRQNGWAWDKANTPFGESASCTIPKSALSSFDDMGYEEGQLVYVVVNGRKILVSGVNDGDTIQFNTPAVKIMNTGKKKNQLYRTSGNVSYHYSFE